MSEILTIFFLEISDLTSTHAGPAGQPRKERSFLENRKHRGANLLVCGQRNVKGLVTTTFRSPLRSRLALGKASFLPVSVRKGVITANIEKKEAGITCVLGAARRFDAECAAEG